MPVPLSAPGVNRTPDLQVRSLRDVGALPCSTHLSPVTTRFPRSLSDARWDQMGWVWAHFGHSGTVRHDGPGRRAANRGRLFMEALLLQSWLHTRVETSRAKEALRDGLVAAYFGRQDFEVVEGVRLEVLGRDGHAGIRGRDIDVELRQGFAPAFDDDDVVA